MDDRIARRNRWPVGKSATIVVVALLGLTLFAVIGITLMQYGSRRARAWNPPDGLDTTRAFGFLQRTCEYGPRPSGSEAIAKLQTDLIAYFEKAGAKVSTQDFDARHPLDGSRVQMRNIIVSLFPELRDRVLLCAHYDTRPYPDQDLSRPRGVFIGANDGASGVALFQELAIVLPKIKSNVGVDLVLFDGEELVYDTTSNGGTYFLGSTEFANRYATEKRDYAYRAGVLVDMIADKELQLFYERNSYDMARPLTREIFQIAERLKIAEFVARVRHEVRDDHLPLNQIAKIPTTDLIDFDYPKPTTRGPSYWHTEQDVPANCSGESICKVAAVLIQWIRQQPAASGGK